MPVSVPDVDPELIEPELEPVVPEFIELDDVPVRPELEVEPVVPEFIEPEVEPVEPLEPEFVLPDVPVLLVVELPEELGFEVEPELTEPLLLLTFGPELAVPPVAPLVEPEVLPVDAPVEPPVEPLVPVPPVLPDWA